MGKPRSGPIQRFDRVWVLTDSKQFKKGKVMSLTDRNIPDWYAVKFINKGRKGMRGGTYAIDPKLVFPIDSDLEMLKVIYGS